MWNADKIVYRNDDSFVRAYQGSELVWEKPSSNNKIFYTSTDGQIVTPDIGIGEESKGFGANIVSNTYSGGRGVIVFDGPVTKIGYTAFGRCNTLQTIVIPDSVTSIGHRAFSYCTSLTTITIPDSVTSIGQIAFFSCERLTSITIPKSVKHIDIGVFGKCTSLISITIPFSVRGIKWDAFKDCSQLSEVIVNAVTPPELYPEQYIGIYNQFENNAPGRKIKVPAESLQAYKTKIGWRDYADSIVSQ